MATILACSPEPNHHFISNSPRNTDLQGALTRCLLTLVIAPPVVQCDVNSIVMSSTSHGVQF